MKRLILRKCNKKFRIKKVVNWSLFLLYFEFLFFFKIFNNFCNLGVMKKCLLLLVLVLLV